MSRNQPGVPSRIGSYATIGLLVLMVFVIAFHILVAPLKIVDLMFGDVIEFFGNLW